MVTNRLVKSRYYGYEVNNSKTRNHPYESEGRFQNEEEAQKVRNQIINKLVEFDIDYILIVSSEENCEYIADKIAKEIKENE